MNLTHAQQSAGFRPSVVRSIGHDRGLDIWYTVTEFCRTVAPRVLFSSRFALIGSAGKPPGRACAWRRWKKKRCWFHPDRNRREYRYTAFFSFLCVRADGVQIDYKVGRSHATSAGCVIEGTPPVLKLYQMDGLARLRDGRVPFMSKFRPAGGTAVTPDQPRAVGHSCSWTIGGGEVK